MTPAVLIVKPAGKPVALQVKLGVPPEVAMVTAYPVFKVAPGSNAGPVMVNAGLITNVKVLEVTTEFPSVTAMLGVKVPLTEGVPVMSPAVLIANPVGKFADDQE